MPTRTTTRRTPARAPEEDIDTFRKRVAEEIENYRLNGDLCEDEARDLIERLGLTDLVVQKVHIYPAFCVTVRVKSGGTTDFASENASQRIVEDTVVWLGRQLVEQLNTEHTVEGLTVEFTAVEVLPDTNYEECEGRH